MEDYPKTYAELEKSFATDEACREYLYGFRWPNGFLCPKCGGKKMSVTAEGLYLCLACNRKTSVIQGTIFQDSHLPLIIWLRAIWHICSEKSGASALGLKRALGLGSYRTAWLMLHKLRKAKKLKLFLAIVAESTLKHFRTIKNFVKRLAESFRTQTFSELAMNPEALGKIQIRLDSS